MIYLLSKFPCVLDYGERISIIPDCKYCVQRDVDTPIIVYGKNGELPFVFDFCESKNVMKITYGSNLYYILKPRYPLIFTTDIKFMSSRVSINISSKLVISIDGEVLAEREIESIEYSHFEIRRNILLIYFKGKRNYVVVIKDKALCIATYYDEINIAKDELYFMCKCYDSLNHGKVFIITKEYKFDTYLVYLGDKYMQTKDEFVPFVFLDAVRAGNYKYANKLLAETIRLEDEKKLIEFFADFDDYVVLDDAFALVNKNTLAGIYKFDIECSQISNINCLN